MSEETQVRLELVKALLARGTGQVRSVVPESWDAYAVLGGEVDRLAGIVMRTDRPTRQPPKPTMPPPPVQVPQRLAPG